MNFLFWKNTYFSMDFQGDRDAKPNLGHVFEQKTMILVV
jgi:hypothetical protein